MRMQRILIFATVTVLLSACTKPRVHEASDRVEIQIKQNILSNGDVRYSIPVRIGNAAPVETMLDTGSTGLRILPGAISPDNYVLTDHSNDYGYGSGVTMSGTVGKATVGVGGDSTNESIPIQIVQKIGCSKDKPACPASRVALSAYGFGGDGLPGEGFKAIIGVALPPSRQQGEVVNPFGHMGSGAWIIVLPRPGRIDPGKLIINPDQNDLAGFTLFKDLIPLPRFKTQSIAGCLHNQTANKEFCGPIMFDTGANLTTVWTSLAPPRNWPDGMRGAFIFGDHADLKAGAEFVVDHATPGSKVNIKPPLGPLPTVINAGILPYFRYEVYYNVEKNEIGLKQRE